VVRQQRLQRHVCGECQRELRKYGEHRGQRSRQALLVGVLGGLLSAAGYLVYQRLPEDQKERLQGQAKQMLQQRITELRQNFNI